MEDGVKPFEPVLALEIPDGTLGRNCKGSLLEGRTGVASGRTSLGPPGTSRVSGEGRGSRPKSPYRILS